MAKYEKWIETEDSLAKQEEKEFRNRHNGLLTGVKNMTKIICDKCGSEEHVVRCELKTTLISDKKDYHGLTQVKKDLCQVCWTHVKEFMEQKQ